MTVRREDLGLRLPWWVQPLNRVLLALNRVGVPVPMAHVLRMTGRRTGKVRDVVITPFAHDGQRYVIVGIPGSAWTPNVRPTGTAELRHGRKSEPVRLTEVTDDAEKRRVMRAYPSIQPPGVYPFRIMGHVRLVQSRRMGARRLEGRALPHRPHVDQ